MSDIRLNWIKQRIYELLNIADDAIFKEFLERDDGKLKNELLRYLSETRDGSEIAMLFYLVRRQEEERVEVEITESEAAEARHSRTSTPFEPSANLLKADDPADLNGAPLVASSDAKAKKGKGRKAKGGKKKVEEEAKRVAEAEEAAAKAAAEAEQQRLQQEEAEIKVPRTKIIVQKVWHEYLYMVTGVDISFELIAHMNCAVFLRTQDGGIAEPREKDPLSVNRYMLRHFEIVTLNGNGLILLEDMLVDVYMPLLAYFEHRVSYIPSTSSVEFSRSSQSSAVERESSSKDLDGKVSASTGVAFTMLRDEFMHQMHKFKTAISVIKEQLDARVNLVVPPSLHLEDSLEDNLANVMLLQQIQEVCSGWFKQVGLIQFLPYHIVVLHKSSFATTAANGQTDRDTEQ